MHHDQAIDVMSTIVFYCNKCGAKLSAEPDEVGASFDCPSCTALQTVPGSSPVVTAVEHPHRASLSNGPKTLRVPKRKVHLGTQKFSVRTDLGLSPRGVKHVAKPDGCGLSLAGALLLVLSLIVFGLGVLYGLVRGQPEYQMLGDLFFWMALFLLFGLGVSMARLLFFASALAQRAEYLYMKSKELMATILHEDSE